MRVYRKVNKASAMKEIIWEPKKRASHVPFELKSYNSHFIPMKYISQNGPQCGFAALCMIASSVGVHFHPEDLVLKAKIKKITNYGEMFSAQDLAAFAHEILSVQYNVTLKSHSIKGFCYEFKKYFDDENLILIPYDCDFNNAPCLRNGASAHWAILCGYIDGGSEENFYVLACHGKSQHVSAWRYSDLQRSNENLNDLGIKRKLDNKNYIIPQGGLKKGISSKWIVFERRK